MYEVWVPVKEIQQKYLQHISELCRGHGKQGIIKILLPEVGGPHSPSCFPISGLVPSPVASPLLGLLFFFCFPSQGFPQTFSL